MTRQNKSVLQRVAHEWFEENDAKLLQEIEEANRNPDFAFTERDREWLDSLFATSKRATV